MLSQAASRTTASLNSAVLHSDLTPNVLLNKCLSALAGKADNSLTGLVAPPGLQALRRRIAGLMLTRGVVCGPDDILVTSGDTIALELALEAVAPRGATVAIETPTYYGILQTIERLGMRALPIRTHGKLGLDVDHLEEALKLKKVAVIFLNPTLQNPRGFIMPDETRARLSQIACDADVPIIEDDIFSTLSPKASARAPSRATTAAGRRFTVRHSPRPSRPVIASVGVWPANTATRFWRRCFPATWRFPALRKMSSTNSSGAATWKSTAPGSGRNWHRMRALSKRWCARISQREPCMCRHAGVHPLDRVAGTHEHDGAGSIGQRARLPRGRERDFFADGHASTGVRICLGTALTPEVISILKVIAECAHLAGRPSDVQQMLTEQHQETAIS
ncbi:aminotransferase class I/II-fold pyridoxal phosphate-dependent enzyme [Pseudomonas sp. H22_DOA]|nr:aminotransferase class I/II-fold pyridoxal phosphate-dependent enzyme [Pseudomonas sp. H22_DOA]